MPPEEGPDYTQMPEQEVGDEPKPEPEPYEDLYKNCREEATLLAAENRRLSNKIEEYENEIRYHIEEVDKHWMVPRDPHWALWFCFTGEDGSHSVMRLDAGSAVDLLSGRDVADERMREFVRASLRTAERAVAKAETSWIDEIARPIDDDSDEADS